MNAFHHPLYRFLLKSIRLTLLFVYRKRIIREMRDNDYLVATNISVASLYRFWFEDCEWREPETTHYLIEDEAHGTRQVVSQPQHDSVLH